MKLNCGELLYELVAAPGLVYNVWECNEKTTTCTNSGSVLELSHALKGRIVPSFLWS